MTSAHYITVFSTNLSNASVNPGRVKALPIGDGAGVPMGDGAGVPMGDQLRNLNIKKPGSYRVVATELLAKSLLTMLL